VLDAVDDRFLKREANAELLLAAETGAGHLVNYGGDDAACE
jgi:hypothetical protein